MENYLIFTAIGGLLLLTLLVNSVAEAYEQRQREKRLKILSIKRGLDNISDLLERLQNCNISKEVKDLLFNEIMARIEAIQRIDRNFRGVQALIEEAGEAQENIKTPPASDNFNIRDETDFKLKMRTLAQLIRLLNTAFWYTKVKPQQLDELIKNLKVLRCEMIFQFYSDKANSNVQKHKYLLAQENYHYVLHALQSSGVADHPRIVELIEQSRFMLKQIASDMSKYMYNMSNKGKDSDKTDQEQDKDNSQENEQQKSDDAQV